MSDNSAVKAKLVIILKADDTLVEEVESPELWAYFLARIISRRVPDTAKKADADFEEHARTHYPTGG